MRISALPALAAVAALAACGSPTPAPRSSTSSAPPPAAALDLTGICPSTVVIQADWQPEAEHGAMYELLGPGYTVDASRKRVSGPLMIGGKNTGVRIEIRAGGSAIGFQTVPSQMYIDKTITLGFVTTDIAIAAAANQPVTAVVSPLDKSPQILFWDPASHPTWSGIADIGHSNAKVVVTKDQVFSQLLVNKALVRANQIDTSYDGSPARFVADPTIAEQGFATDEPYIYQYEVPAWGKPVKYQLLSDIGYNVYPSALSVRSGDIGPLSACLRKLVPIIQQAQVEYLNSPGATNNIIVDTVRRYNDGWNYSAGVANYAVRTMRQLKIVANDSSGPVGGMGPTRVQTAIDTYTPILTASGASIKPGLTAADIMTNQFIDKSVILK